MLIWMGTFKSSREVSTNGPFHRKCHFPTILWCLLKTIPGGIRWHDCEEEGELEEDDDKEEEGQKNQEEQDNDDLYRKLIEDELMDSDVE